MHQVSNKIDSNIAELFTNEAVDNMVNHLESKTIKMDIIEDDEMDLTKEYIVNWSCIWNNPKNVGKKGRILFKNNKLAFLAYDGKFNIDKISTTDLYRLEDLTELN